LPLLYFDLTGEYKKEEVSKVRSKRTLLRGPTDNS